MSSRVSLSLWSGEKPDKVRRTRILSNFSGLRVDQSTIPGYNFAWALTTWKSLEPENIIRFCDKGDLQVWLYVLRWDYYSGFGGDRLYLSNGIFKGREPIPADMGVWSVAKEGSEGFWKWKGITFSACWLRSSVVSDGGRGSEMWNMEVSGSWKKCRHRLSGMLMLQKNASFHLLDFSPVTFILNFYSTEQ